MSSMSIKTTIAVACVLPAEKSVMLRGIHGIGKSQVVRKIAKLIAEKEGLEKMPVIDRRLSQMSEGDVIGLPSTDGEVTRFNPPDWFKRACLEPCILFLDELNRATPEVMQAAFQIALDHELNSWKLHPKTRVYTAINNSAAYTVNEMDPALIDRFWVVDLNPTVEDWVAWAKDKDPETGGNIDPVLIDFVVQAEQWLDPQKNADPQSKTTSRRTWAGLNNSLVGAGIMDKPDHPLFYPMCLGFVGTEATIAFHSFAKTIDNQVTGEDIIERYSKVKNKILKMGEERHNVAIQKATDYVHKLTKITEVQGKNICEFMTDLGHEHRVSAWAKFTASGIDRLEVTKGIHKHCAKLVLEVFGVPMGQAGVGVVPNIPGIFKQPAK